MKKLCLILLLFSTQVFAAPPCDVPLVTGWNLVGARVKMPVHSFFPDPAAIVSVWKWNAGQHAWEFYAPNLPDRGLEYANSNDYIHLYGMRETDGVWVNASEPTLFHGCLTISDTPPTPW